MTQLSLPQTGPIVRIAPNTLLTCDEDFIRRLTAIQTPYVRNKWFKAVEFDADKQSVLSELNPDKHLFLRAKVAPGYGGKENPELEASIDKVIFEFINLIRRKYISTPVAYKPMDLAQKCQFFTVDLITSLSLSQPFGFLANDEDVYEYVKTVQGMLPMMNMMIAIPWFGDLMRQKWYKRFVAWAIGDKTGVGRTKVVAHEIVAKRFALGDEKEVRRDMLGSFIRRGLSQTECADEAMNQIFAGSDTTATAIKTLLLHIISNARVQAKLLEEIRRASIPIDRVITDKEARKLPYLQACIIESLRMWPPAVGLTPKDSPPEGDWLPSGIYIPGGTAIGHCFPSVQHNKAVYGPDADIFRPERWLDASPEKLALMEKTRELVFGYGRHRCLGIDLAKIELNKLGFEMIRRFDINLQNPEKAFDRMFCTGLFGLEGMWVRIQEREW